MSRLGCLEFVFLRRERASQAVLYYIETRLVVMKQRSFKSKCSSFAEATVLHSPGQRFTIFSLRDPPLCVCVQQLPACTSSTVLQKLHISLRLVNILLSHCVY